MPIGRIKAYNDDRGFGFIKPFDGSKDVFFHAVELGEVNPVLGCRIGYEVGPNRAASAKDDPNKSIMAVRLRYV
jgi:cold shock CspA family protein